MGYFLLFGGLAVVAFSVCWYIDEHTRYDDIVFCLIGIFSVIALVLGAVIIPFARWETNAEIAKYKSMQTTLDASRENSLELEDVAFQIKVAEWNQWLAGKQYYNSIWQDPWIPDEVDTLKLIK